MIDASLVSTIILAAGSADRLGGGGKAFLEVGGQTYLSRCVEKFAPYSDQVIVALSPENLKTVAPNFKALACHFIAGGETRQSTIELAVRHCTGAVILVHDVARPLVLASDIRQLIEAADTHSAVTLTQEMKVRDALTYVTNGYVSAPAERTNLCAVQTPQAYHKEVLNDVLSRARTHNWEETSLVPLCKRAGIAVRCLEGSAQNIKVTYPEDIQLVERLSNQT